jgi:hypothetical protein
MDKKDKKEEDSPFTD